MKKILVLIAAMLLLACEKEIPIEDKKIPIEEIEWPPKIWCAYPSDSLAVEKGY